MINFLQEGGFFMWAILACSFVTVTIGILKVLQLRRIAIIPLELEEMLISIQGSAGELHKIHTFVGLHPSKLGTLCQVILELREWPREHIQARLEARSQEEIIDLNRGVNALEVIYTIAPLLGLLGTASGLVTVFASLGESQDYSVLAIGISRALSTTIAGLAVAIPAVIMHTYFESLIFRYVARLEVLIERLVNRVIQSEGA